MPIKIELPDDYYDFPARNFKSETNIVGNRSGVYILLDKDGLALYVGKATNLRGRLRTHLSERSHVVDIIPFVKSVRVYFIPDEYEREVYETYAIQEFQPSRNCAKVFFDRYGEDALYVEERLYEIRTRIRELEDDRMYLIRESYEDPDEYDDEDSLRFSQSLSYIEIRDVDEELRRLREEREILRKKTR